MTELNNNLLMSASMAQQAVQQQPVQQPADKEIANLEKAFNAYAASGDLQSLIDSLYPQEGDGNVGVQNGDIVDFDDAGSTDNNAGLDRPKSASKGRNDKVRNKFYKLVSKMCGGMPKNVLGELKREDYGALNEAGKKKTYDGGDGEFDVSTRNKKLSQKRVGLVLGEAYKAIAKDSGKAVFENILNHLKSGADKNAIEAKINDALNNHVDELVSSGRLDKAKVDDDRARLQFIAKDLLSAYQGADGKLDRAKFVGALSRLDDLISSFGFPEKHRAWHSQIANAYIKESGKLSPTELGQALAYKYDSWIDDGVTAGEAFARVFNALLKGANFGGDKELVNAMESVAEFKQQMGRLAAIGEKFQYVPDGANREKAENKALNELRDCFYRCLVQLPPGGPRNDIQDRFDSFFFAAFQQGRAIDPSAAAKTLVLQPEYMQLLKDLAANAIGSGWREGLKGGAGYMGILPDGSVVKLLTKSGERRDDLSDTLTKGQITKVNEASAMLKTTLVRLAQGCGVEKEVEAILEKGLVAFKKKGQSNPDLFLYKRTAVAEALSFILSKRRIVDHTTGVSFHWDDSTPSVGTKDDTTIAKMFGFAEDQEYGELFNDLFELVGPDTKAELKQSDKVRYANAHKTSLVMAQTGPSSVDSSDIRRKLWDHVHAASLSPMQLKKVEKDGFGITDGVWAQNAENSLVSLSQAVNIARIMTSARVYKELMEEESLEESAKGPEAYYQQLKEDIDAIKQKNGGDELVAKRTEDGQKKSYAAINREALRLRIRFMKHVEHELGDKNAFGVLAIRKDILGPDPEACDDSYFRGYGIQALSIQKQLKPLEEIRSSSKMVKPGTFQLENNVPRMAEQDFRAIVANEDVDDWNALYITDGNRPSVRGADDSQYGVDDSIKMRLHLYNIVCEKLGGEDSPGCKKVRNKLFGMRDGDTAAFDMDTVKKPLRKVDVADVLKLFDEQHCKNILACQDFGTLSEYDLKAVVSNGGIERETVFEAGGAAIGQKLLSIAGEKLGLQSAGYDEVRKLVDDIPAKVTVAKLGEVLAAIDRQFNQVLNVGIDTFYALANDRGVGDSAPVYLSTRTVDGVTRGVIGSEKPQGQADSRLNALQLRERLVQIAQETLGPDDKSFKSVRMQLLGDSLVSEQPMTAGEVRAILRRIGEAQFDALHDAARQTVSKVVDGTIDRLQNNRIFTSDRGVGIHVIRSIGDQVVKLCDGLIVSRGGGVLSGDVIAAINDTVAKLVTGLETSLSAIKTQLDLANLKNVNPLSELPPGDKKYGTEFSSLVNGLIEAEGLRGTVDAFDWKRIAIANLSRMERAYDDKNGFLPGKTLGRDKNGSRVLGLAENKEYQTWAVMAYRDVFQKVGPAKVLEQEDIKTESIASQFVEVVGAGSTVLHKMAMKHGAENVWAIVAADGSHFGGTITSGGADEDFTRGAYPRLPAALIALGLARVANHNIHFNEDETGLTTLRTSEGFVYEVTADNADGTKLKDKDVFDSHYWNMPMPTFATLLDTNTDIEGDKGWAVDCRAMLGYHSSREDVATLGQVINRMNEFWFGRDCIGNPHAIAEGERASLLNVLRQLDVGKPQAGADAAAEWDVRQGAMKKLLAVPGVENKTVMRQGRLEKWYMMQDILNCVMFAADKMKDQGVDLFDGTKSLDEKMVDLLKFFMDANNKEKVEGLIAFANENYEKLVTARIATGLAKIEEAHEKAFEAKYGRKPGPDDKIYLVGCAFGCGYFENDSGVMSRCVRNAFSAHPRCVFVMSNYEKYSAIKKGKAYKESSTSHISVFKGAFSKAG